MNRLAKILLTGVTAVVLASSVALPVGAIDLFSDACKGSSDPTCVEAKSGDAQKNASSYINNIVDALLYIVGGLAVIMIVIGGIRYITSAGNAQSVQSAKNMIMYSVVGLIVALLAYAISNFVIKGMMQ